MNTGRSTIMTNTGCKYQGTSEPCEGYREAKEVLAEAETYIRKVQAAIESLSEGAFGYVVPDEPYREGWPIRDELIHRAELALTRINRLKDIDQPREKE
jgi:hypothetical protein